MEFALSDSSGTDDDLPPMQQNRFAVTGRAAANVRSVAVCNTQVHQMHTDMETHIHRAEQEAYTSVLRAFKAQSDAISWDKESLITELRKELRVSDEEHRELLSKVNADDVIGRIREWRKGGGPKHVYDSVHSPMFSASVKKQKTPQSVASLSASAPSPALDPPFQPSLAALKRGPASDSRGKKPKSISPEDIRRDGVQSGSGDVLKTSVDRGGATKGPLKNYFPSLKNRTGKVLADIEILQTDALIKQADKVFNASRLDPSEVEKARKLLKDHEQALVDAIAMLEGASDSESEADEEHKRLAEQERDRLEIQDADGNIIATDGKGLS